MTSLDREFSKLDYFERKKNTLNFFLKVTTIKKIEFDYRI